METDGLSLKERSAAVCRQFARERDGASFFTAWAFPMSERIHSCRRHHAGNDSGPLAIKSRNGRIVVNADGDHSLNISDGPGSKNGDASWGVLIFLNQVEKGRCRISDMELLAPDREYDLGGERLVWLGTADEAQGLEFIRGLLAADGVHDAARAPGVCPLPFQRSGRCLRFDRPGPPRPGCGNPQGGHFLARSKSLVCGGQGFGRRDRLSRNAGDQENTPFSPSASCRKKRARRMLLEIARRNPYPRLRKEAIFWLGESGDPRALDFFEEILLK